MHDYDKGLLREALVSTPFVNSVTDLHPRSLAEPWAKKRSVRHGFKLDIDLNGESVSFYFGVKDSFPLSLPRVFLFPWDKFGILPHVETDGYVCYAQEEDLLLDFEDIRGIAQEALFRAVQVVTDGISSKNHKDFIDEFGAYWDRLEKVKHVTSIVSTGDHVRRISLIKVGAKSAWYLADDELSFKKYRKIKALSILKRYPAIYVPLLPGTFIKPPHPSKFWELSDIRKIIYDNIEEDQLVEFISLVARPHHEEMLLFKLPRSSGGETLFGIEFKGINRAHPLFEAEKAREIIPVSINRRDKEYLLPRGGSNLSLRENRVLLLGCGSLGGFVANELTRAGILHLTVLDKDILTDENLFRHVLGKKHVANSKAEGIKQDIEGRLPYVEVISIRSSLEDALKFGEIITGDYDLVISALGNVTVELAFNKHVHTASAPPVIFTWLEPYGIGGHALLTRLNGSKYGCLKCLYQFEDGEICCRASFAEKNQSFFKNIDGCRNVFTPFGSLDAIKTAELATRLAIATLNGDVKTNLIRSWRGDATEFLKNSKKLSSRYLGSNDHFLEIAEYHNDECPVCHES